jgi:hypothetical protein
MLGVLRISNQRPLGDHRRPFQVGGNQRRAGREAAARRVPDQLLRVINGISGQTAISDGDPLQIGGRDHLPGLQPAIEHRHLDLLSQPPGHGEALQRRAAGDGCQHGGEAPTRRLVGETLDREFGIGRDGAPRRDARELQRSPGDIDPPVGQRRENGLLDRRVRQHLGSGPVRLRRSGGNAAGLNGERTCGRHPDACEKAQDRQRKNTHKAAPTERC